MWGVYQNSLNVKKTILNLFFSKSCLIPKCVQSMLKKKVCGQCKKKCTNYFLLYKYEIKQSHILNNVRGVIPKFP